LPLRGSAMIDHVALQKSPSNVTQLRSQRGPAVYLSSANSNPRLAAEQARESVGMVPPVDAKMLAKAVHDLSAGAQNLQRSLQFSIDESSGRTVIKVIDKITQEVIRQIPEEEVLALAARLEKSTGRLVQDEA
jgi:flagellar protein FlaG